MTSHRPTVDRFVPSLAIVAALVLLGAAGRRLDVRAQSQTPGAPAAEISFQQRTECLAGGEARSVRHPRTGALRFVGTEPGRSIGQPRQLAASASPESAARSYLSVCGSLFGLSDPSAQLVMTRSTTADDGKRSIVRFRQMHRGIPVIGGDLVVHLSGFARDILTVAGKTLPAIDLATTPAIDQPTAAQSAREVVSKAYGVDVNALAVSVPQLAIYNPMMIGPDSGPTSLVWQIEVTPRTLLPIRELVLVDAQRGSVLLHFNQVDTALARQTYTAGHSTTLPGTLVCDESNPNCVGGDIEAAAAHLYAADTYNFYKTIQGRDSIDGLGLVIQQTVHYGSHYQNSFWTGQQMAYGDGWAADDLVGHELTHGVTQYTSNLYYYYQSGAINESLSDVWGELIDQSNGHGTDTAAVKWLVGEDIAGLGAIRSMSNPPAFSNPDRMTSPFYVLSDEDSGGVHYNSGINNKAAFLMVDGGTFNGQTIAPLGITKVAKVYYEVQTHLLTSGSDYGDLYEALYQGCNNLVGTSDITSADCQEVRKATLAVEMNLQPVVGFNPEAPVCAAGQAVTNLFFDNLEGGSANWVAGGLVGIPRWTYDSPWGIFAHSGLHFLYANDLPPEVSDSYVAMSSGVQLPAGAYLHFAHAFTFEAPNRDAGVVEYSTNDGASWVDAGPLFDANGYRGAISTDFGNPLAGRSGFIGNSHGYMSSRLNLSSLAGMRVRFRWRMGLDSSGSGRGWFIDDVRIHTCAAAPAGPAAATFLRTDTTTQGNWINHYGASGYAIPNDATSYPGYAQVSVAANGTYTWAPSTTDVRALQHPSGVGRQAATWYGSTGFAADVNLTDGVVHQVALYGLDWDASARVERVDVKAADTGDLLDSRTLSGFNGGTYLVWSVRGHVTFNVTLTGGANAVASGLFFDEVAAGGPLVALSGDLAFGTVGVNETSTRTLTISNPGSAPLIVTGISYPASFSGNWAGGTIAVGGSQAVTVTFAPTAQQSYGGAISVNGNMTGGTNTIQASGNGLTPNRLYTLSGSLAFGDVGVNQTATRTLTILNVGNLPLTVTAISYPAGFSGDWTGGVIAVNASQAVQVTFAPTSAATYSGNVTVVSNGVNQDPNPFPISGRGIAPMRIIALSGNLSPFWSVPVNTTDTRTLTIGNSGNATLTVTGITYPSGFTGNWPGGTVAAGGSQNVTVTFAPTAPVGYGGTITVNANQTSGTNTVAVSGIGTVSRIVSLAGNMAFGSVPVNATAISNLTISNAGNAPLTVSSVTYPAGFSGNWTGGAIAPGGTQNVTVTFAPTLVASYAGVITVNGDQTGGTNTIAASGTGCACVSDVATFVRTDPATQGSWMGSYGHAGYAVVNDATSYPAYAQVAVAANGTYTWQAATNDSRALQHATGGGRLAATWYGFTGFTIDVNLTDGASHQIALYGLDWDGNARAERIDVKSGSGTLLDTQTISGFNGGKYLVWTIRGHVTFNVTLTGGANAVLSGLFFDEPAGPAIGLSGDLAFGSVPVNTTAARTLTIGNPGSAPMTVTGISYPSGFSGNWAGGTVAAGGSQSVTVTFAPIAATSYGGNITVSSNAASGTNVIAASGTGGSAPVATRIISLTGNMAFGAVPLGMTTTRTLTIGNSGTAALNVSSISFAAGFSGNWAGGAIAAGGTQNVVVTFEPAAVASYGGTITVNGDQTSGTNTIAASGSGVAAPSTSAVFVRTDTTTQGNWIGHYGTGGYGVVNDAASYPGYAQVAPSVNGTYTWQAATSDPRALQHAGGAGRLAATWYGFAALALDVNLTDGATHQIALYGLDWDGNERVERVDVKDAATSAILDTQMLSGFNGGKYLVWSVRGHVTFVVTLQSGANAVLSGLFFDEPAGPAIALSGNLAFGNLAASSTDKRTLTITNPGQSPLAVSGITYPNAFSGNWPGGTIAPGASQPVTVTFAPVSEEQYGGQIVVNGNQTSGVNTIPVSGSGCVCAIVMFFTGDLTFGTIPVNTTASRTFRINIVGGAGLEVRSIVFPAGFTGDWTGGTIPRNGSQDVTVTFAPTAQTVYSGPVTVDRCACTPITASGTGGSPPSVTRIISLSGNLAFGSVPVGSTASSTLAIGNSGNAPLTVSSITYPSGFSGNWAGGTIAAGGSQAVSVTFAPAAAANYGGAVTVNGDQTSGANTIAVSGAGVSAPSTSATFVRTDTTTQGSWITHYGSNGYAVVNNATSYPGYAQVTVTADGTYTWQASTGDVRALQASSGSGRLASTWYGYSGFTIDVNLTDGAAHQIALYGLDWDVNGRAERVDVKAADGTMLDTRTLSGFGAGKYLVWTVRGHVSFVVTLTSGVNAVLSGLFFDAPGSPAGLSDGAEAVLSKATVPAPF